MAGRAISPMSSLPPPGRKAPGLSIEVLTPDFLRKDGAIEVVMEARADVFV